MGIGRVQMVRKRGEGAAKLGQIGGKITRRHDIKGPEGEGQQEFPQSIDDALQLQTTRNVNRGRPPREDAGIGTKRCIHRRRTT